MKILLRLLPPLTGLAVAALGLVVALEVIWAWVRPTGGSLVLPWRVWQQTLEGWNWTSGPVRLIAAGLMVVGLFLLVLARATSRHGVRLSNPGPDIAVTISARSLARLVRHQIRELDHVASVSVTVTARKVSVRAASRQSSGAVTPDITATVGALLSKLPLAHTPQVSVAVRKTGKTA